MEKYKQIIIQMFQKYRNFIMYSIIGCMGASIDFVAFFLLNNVFSWNVVLSNVVSVSLGITNNFILNAVFNFKTKDRLFFRFISFYLVGFIGLGLSSLILYIFVEKLEFNNLIIKALSIIIVVIVQYTLNKKISFHKFTQENETN